VHPAGCIFRFRKHCRAKLEQKRTGMKNDARSAAFLFFC